MRHDGWVSENPYAPPHDPEPTPAYPTQPVPVQPAAAPAQSSPAQYPVATSPSASPQTDGTAITAFVLSLCAWFVLPVILAIVSLVLASNADKSIAASNGTKTGEGLVKAAKIISWLNLLLFGLAIVFVVAFFIGLAVGG